ncbi:phosphoethanolamine transferase [Parvibaculum sp.]|uniref:phosphoethanolamine transferase n=1 Tax=Parvibaculum sp. TaxID=2024848 RepID=UPI00391DB85A
MPLSILVRGMLQRAAAVRLPPLHPLVVALGAAALLVLFYNGQLWSAVPGWWPGRSVADIAFMASIGFVLCAAFYLVIQAFAFPRLLKPVLATLFLTAAGVSYFASAYGVMMDRGMIANILETDTHEAGDLMSLSFLLHMAVYGLLPAALAMAIPLRCHSLWREALQRAGAVAASLLVIAASAAFFYQDYAVLVRSHREVRFMINPSAAIYGAFRYATAVPSAMASEFKTIAEYAERVPALDGRKTVMVLVVGETARADHFSLNGYDRETTPLLAVRDVVSFGEVRSCATSTAESVPCMFSDLGRSGYSPMEAASRENLLDIAVRAGVDVLWLENNSSCKGVCARVPVKTAWEFSDPAYCSGGECLDDVLADQLKFALARNENDLLVVFHQIGSHGPAYYKRSTPDYNAFGPICETSEIQSCSQEQIVNTYDNSIRYTDHILADIIDTLTRASDRFDTALLYVSDHGESLGEGGLYLHGLPYMFAPDVQKHVPMVFWASPEYRDAVSLDDGCLARGAGTEYSHDNLFHSVLGLLDIRTDAYRSDLDIFAPCRPAARTAALTGKPGTGGSMVR